MARGGYRFGAGRPSTRSKVTAHRRLDVRLLDRAGGLSAGCTSELTWPSANSNQSFQLWVRAFEHHIELLPCLDPSYVYAGIRISLAETSCGFGGVRRWFECPNCEQRAVTLFLAGRVACRKCLDLRYPSQSESEIDRIWRRKRRLAARLGSDGSDWQWKFKPAGMHQTTFDRIRRDLTALEERLVEILRLGLVRLTSSSLSDRLLRHQ